MDILGWHSRRSHSGAIRGSLLASPYTELHNTVVCRQGFVFRASANLLDRAPGGHVLDGSELPLSNWTGTLVLVSRAASTGFTSVNMASFLARVKDAANGCHACVLQAA